MIESIYCSGYRGFAEGQTLNLAIPNGKRGSGLTVLIGPNGGGKSTIIECFSKLSLDKVSFTEGKRNKLAGDKVLIRIKYDSHLGILSTVNEGGSETSWEGELEKPKMYCLPSRRVFNPFFNKYVMNRDTYIRNPDDAQFRGRELNNFTHRLFDDLIHYEEFNKLFWKILGKKINWTIEQGDSGQYYVKIIKEGTISHNSDGLGEGIVSLLFITDALLGENKDELIVIDEPELSLHPQLQRRLLREILELTKYKQIVIATHSANMLSIEAAINGGEIARVFEKKGSSVIASIDDKCRAFFKSYTANNYNPHIIGYDARECFFAEDGYIITEGQEDVVLLPIISKQLGIDKDLFLYGFGAGGASNIQQIAYILKCLGFSHIGALFDGDKVTEYNNFLEEYKNDGYRAWILPADDIRDKPERINKSKSGILDSNNNIKPENKTSELLKLMNEMIDFSNFHR